MFFLDYVASPTVTAFHAVVFSGAYNPWSVSIWFRETQPGKVSRGEEHSLSSVEAHWIPLVEAFGQLLPEKCESPLFLWLSTSQVREKENQRNSRTSVFPKSPPKWATPNWIDSMFGWGLSFNSDEKTQGALGLAFVFKHPANTDSQMCQALLLKLDKY